jgi:hypothetical protein
MRLDLLAAGHGGLRNRPPAVPTFFLNLNSCAAGYGISVESVGPLPPEPNTRLLILPFLQRTSTQIGFVFSFSPVVFRFAARQADPS